MNGQRARLIRKRALVAVEAGEGGEHPVTGDTRTAKSLARRMRRLYGATRRGHA